MERKFKKSIGSLEEVFTFVDESISALEVDASVAYAITLAIEEFFTNMVKYSSEASNDVSISLSREGKQLMVTMVDDGVGPFDVTRANDVDTSLPLEERKVGGLGIHLVRNMLDSVTYDYTDRQSRITFIKKLEK
jgi:anti-sigma regulatory factor (Ser/Thr protein kinase)